MAFSVRALTASCLCFRPNEPEEAREKRDQDERTGFPEHEFEVFHGADSRLFGSQ
jgi:hypothetical protein